MPMFERVSGVWKEIPKPSEQVSGVWKDLLEGWENVSGAWKQFYIGLTLKLSKITVIGVNNASGGFEANRDGVLRWGVDNPSGWSAATEEWVAEGRSATVGDAFEIRLTKATGTNPTSGPALNTWHQLSANRRWEWAGDPITFDGTATIRDIATAGSKHQVSAAVEVSISTIEGGSG